MPTNRGHYRITRGDALSAHEEALKYGGLPGINSLALVESAIARPYSGYYRRMSQKAAALVQSGATNHGFIDGNKRTTLILLNLLLAKSGYVVKLSNQEANAEFEKIILAAVKHEMTLDAIENWFRRHLVRSEV